MKQYFNEKDDFIREENERFESARERFFFVFLIAIFIIAIIYAVIRYAVIPMIKHLF